MVEDLKVTDEILREAPQIEQDVKDAKADAVKEKREKTKITGAVILMKGVTEQVMNRDTSVDASAKVSTGKVYIELKSAIINDIIKCDSTVKDFVGQLRTINVDPAISAALLDKLLDPFLNNPGRIIDLSPVGGSKTDFEKMMDDLRSVSKTAYNDAIIALKKTALYTEAEIDAKFPPDPVAVSSEPHAPRVLIDAKLNTMQEEIESARKKKFLDYSDRITHERAILDAANGRKKTDLEKALRDVGISWRPEKIDDYLALWQLSTADDTPEEQARNDSELLDAGIISDSLKVFRSGYLLEKTNFDRYFPPDSTGKRSIHDDLKKEITKSMYLSVNKLLKSVSASPDADWDTIYNQLYEGRLERLIRNRIMKIADDPRVKEHLRSEGLLGEFSGFIQQTAQEMQGEIQMRQAYHTVRNYIYKDQVTPDKIADYLKSFPASRVGLIMQGYNGTLFEIAQSEFERDLQDRIFANNSQIPVDLFANTFDLQKRIYSKDYDRLKNNIIDRVSNERKYARAILAKLVPGKTIAMVAAEEVKTETDAIDQSDIPTAEKTTRKKTITDQKEAQLKRLKDSFHDLDEASDPANSWEIERVMILAPGVSLLNTMRAHEIMAMAKPRGEGDFTGSPIYSFARFFNIRANWGRGRGGERSTSWRVPELFELNIKKFGKAMNNMPWWWIPKRLYNKAMWEQVSQGDFVKLLDDSKKLGVHKNFGYRFGEYLQRLSIYGFFSRGSWRFKGFTSWFEAQFGVKHDDNWRLSYEYLQKYVGAGSRWLFDEARVKDEIKDYYFTKRYGKDYKTTVDPATLGKWTELFEKSEVYKYTINAFENKRGPLGKLKKITKKMKLTEFVDEKILTYRGMNFQALLERSPYDFLTNISQLEHKLIGMFDVTLDDGKTKRQMSAYDYLFGGSRIKLCKADKETRRIELNAILKRWGKENIKPLSQVALAWHRINTQLRDNKGVLMNLDAKGEYKYNKEKTLTYVYGIMANATEKVKMEDRATTTAADIADQNLADIFFDSNGLVTYLKGREEYFASEKGQEHEIGENGFFRTMADLWFNLDHVNILPSTNDMKQLPFFKNIGEKTGEDVFVRQWKDVAAWSKMMEQVGNFDKILIETSQSKKLDKLLELHKTIQDLEGVLGISKAQELNAIMAQATIRFFQEHTLRRLPMPFNLLGGFMTNDASLSRLHSPDLNAWTWKEEEIGEYLFKMRVNHVLSKEMADEIQKLVGADMLKYGTLQVLPTIVMIAIWLTISKFIDIATKEAGPQKK